MGLFLENIKIAHFHYWWSFELISDRTTNKFVSKQTICKFEYITGIRILFFSNLSWNMSFLPKGITNPFRYWNYIWISWKSNLTAQLHCCYNELLTLSWTIFWWYQDKQINEWHTNSTRFTDKGFMCILTLCNSLMIGENSNKRQWTVKIQTNLYKTFDVFCMRIHHCTVSIFLHSVTPQPISAADTYRPTKSVIY